MPLSGALARTATNVKLGAVTPLAGIMKGGLKLLLAYFLAHYLELVPMACIGGILMWVAFNIPRRAGSTVEWPESDSRSEFVDRHVTTRFTNKMSP